MVVIWIVFGLIAGMLAKWLLLPETKECTSGAILLGMTGALIGGLFSHGFGWHPGSHPEDLMLVMLGTMLALVVYGQLVEPFRCRPRVC